MIRRPRRRTFYDANGLRISSTETMRRKKRFLEAARRAAANGTSNVNVRQPKGQKTSTMDEAGCSAVGFPTSDDQMPFVDNRAAGLVIPNAAEVSCMEKNNDAEDDDEEIGERSDKQYIEAPGGLYGGDSESAISSENEHCPRFRIQTSFDTAVQESTLPASAGNTIHAAESTSNERIVDAPWYEEMVAAYNSSLQSVDDSAYVDEGVIDESENNDEEVIDASEDDNEELDAVAPDEDAEDPDCDIPNINNPRYLVEAAGDTMMFEQANLKAWQVLLVILGLSHRFALNFRGRRALIEAAKLFAGPAFTHWNVTDYQISKVIDPPDAETKYHFYCEVCFKELGEVTTRSQFTNREAMCGACLAKYQLSIDSPNSFVTVDLKYQIKSLINLPVVKEKLFENLEQIHNDLDRRTNCETELRDVYDSLLYQKLLLETDENTKLLTYVFNTDGAPLFDSSKQGFWPIQIIINELPPKMRFRYRLLVGVCTLKKEPSPEFMNTFLKSFVKEANELATVGFEVRNNDGNRTRFVLKPLACSVDSVARPILQNRLQFNGYYGCSWCYSMGRHVGGCMRFLMEMIDPCDRTHNEYLKDCKAVVGRLDSTNVVRKKRTNVRGVKGESVLGELKSFDMIHGFVRDNLHADLIGVTLQMFNMWSSDTECPIRLTKRQLDEVNERLMSVTPPHEVHRLVRPLKTEKAKWKASEWRSWLLFYSIPCLCGILNEYALQHFALFVNSIYTLLKTNITEDELRKVDSDLQRFVIVFELLYGEKYVTFNVHTLKHLVRTVRHSGPLWATSTFPFESGIRDYKRAVHGPQSACEQMLKQAMHENILHHLMLDSEDDVTAACYAFQTSLLGKYDITKSIRRCGRQVVLIGHGSKYEPTESERRILVDEGDQNHDDLILRFKRCVKSGTVVSSVAYERQKKSDNTMFRDKRGVAVRVLELLYCRNTAFVKVSCYKSKNVVLKNVGSCRDNFEVCPIEIQDVIANHLFEIDEGQYCNRLIPLADLTEKCVLMKIGDKTYVSTLPNTIEIQ